MPVLSATSHICRTHCFHCWCSSTHKDSVGCDSMESAHWPEIIQSFLGFYGICCQFNKGYSSIVRPLAELTKGYLSAKDRFSCWWDQGYTEAFQKIIYCLMHVPVLAFADPAKPYVLHVDGSFNSLGCCLKSVICWRSLACKAVCFLKVPTDPSHDPGLQLGV